MVEQDPATLTHAVCLTVVYHDPICITLSDAVQAARIERGGLALGRLDYPLYRTLKGTLGRTWRVSRALPYKLRRRGGEYRAH